MHRVTSILCSLAVVASAQEIPLGVEHSQNLGYGFHRDIIAEAAPSTTPVFESVVHYGYLFYRDQKLARIDDCLVSPSGNAIVYQEATTGNIFVFTRADGKTIQLTEEIPGLVREFVWRDGESVVSARVIPAAMPNEPPGKWITLKIPKI